MTQGKNWGNYSRVRNEMLRENKAFKVTSPLSISIRKKLL